MDQIAQAIIQLFQYSTAQARNAYSAILILPGFEGIRFNPLLNPYKKLWNINIEKYSHFWDPLPLLMELASNCIPSDISTLRDTLIIASRLLCLYRSSDLANIKRVVSVVNEVPFIQIKRKGWKVHKWERVVSLPECPQISPFHLMQAYVAKTRSHGKPGGGLLLALKPPYKPLSSDTIGSITKRILESHGVPPKFWGAHSTRGAGVGLMKSLGLSAEEVCEIGKWKGVEAFVAHYQRLGAQKTLEHSLTALVHNRTSLGRSAEPEVSRTPPKFTDRGGSDTEGEAQRTSEVMLFSAGNV